MQVVEKINADWMNARKSADKFKAELLNDLRGEATRVAKDAKTEVNDDIMLKVIRSNVKAMQSTMEDAKRIDAVSTMDELTRKIDILDEFVPKALNEEDTRAWVAAAIGNGTSNLGGVMKAAKESGEVFDNKLLSRIAKELLTK